MIRLALVLMIVVFTVGCGCMRDIEQWKCDHWGMCHFGIQPTPVTYEPMPQPIESPSDIVLAPYQVAQ